MSEQESAERECSFCGARGGSDAWLFFHSKVHQARFTNNGAELGLNRVPFSVMAAIAQVMDEYAASRLAAVTAERDALKQALERLHGACEHVKGTGITLAQWNTVMAEAESALGITEDSHG